MAIEAVAKKLNEPEFEIITGKTQRVLIAETEYKECIKTLQLYTTSAFDGPEWVCTYQSGTKTVKLSFSGLELEEQDMRLLKAYITSALANGLAPTTCQSYISQLRHLYRFIKEKGIHIERMSTSLAHMYHAWLDAEYPDYSDERKNGIESAAARFIGYMQKKNLLPPAPVAFPEKRKTKHKNKQAPEQEVMKQLDRYMLDFSTPVPTDIRCAYIIHRVLPSRNSEVRLIRLEDGYEIKDGLLLLNLPMMKETAYHRPEYRMFPFLCAGTVYENALCRALEEQHGFASAVQPKVQKSHRGFLMVSTAHPKRLLSTQEFNDGLHHVCDTIGLTDYEGNLTYITSHDLRHVAIGNQLRFGIPAEEVQRRSGHKSVDMTMGYGYASKVDEEWRNKQVAAAVQDELISAGTAPEESDTVYRTVLPRRFEKMRKEDGWLLGSDCICGQPGCSPQWEQCIMECEGFQPNPKYLPMAQQICSELEQREKPLTEHEKRQLAIWRKFIEKIGGM